MRVALFAFISALFAAAIISPVQSQSVITQTNDLATLNYALALENLEATYYACFTYPLNLNVSGTRLDCSGRGYTAYTVTDYINAGYNASVYNAIVLIGQQEIAHSNLLQNAVTNYFGTNSGTPVSTCTYILNNIFPGGVTSVNTFLQLASALEQVGVSAYAGAVNTLTDPTLTQIAVSIADVEARHSAWLYQLFGNQPFASSGFETYKTPQDIATQIISVFNQSTCVVPAGATLPTQPRPYGVAYLNASGVVGTNYTGRNSQAAGVSYNSAQRANDLLVLNYALTLEQLEASFYNAAGQVFNQASFTNAGLNASAFNYFGIIGQNENTHVFALRNAILAYGGSYVANCTYNFTSALSSFQNYLNTAQLLENTGVYAYTGAANMITDTNLQRTAAQIAMIEARHAAYINVINSGNPVNNSAAFPFTTDQAITPSNILTAVLGTGLIVANSCPAAVTNVPVLLPINGQIPSSSASQVAFNASSSSSSSFRYSSSSTGNSASSSSSVSALMIIVAIIASLALAL